MLALRTPTALLRRTSARHAASGRLAASVRAPPPRHAPLCRSAVTGDDGAPVKPTILDLITSTRAWQHLNHLVTERGMHRKEVMSFLHAPAMDGLLSALLCPYTAEQMAKDPRLRETVEQAVRSFDSSLSQDDLAYMADLVDHVDRHSMESDSVDASMLTRALAAFGRAPSPGAAKLLAAARSFWTQERVDSFLATAKLNAASRSVVRTLINRLHAPPVRAAALSTVDILEIALPPAEIWAMAEAAAGEGADLDWHDFLDEDFLDEMRLKLAPC